MCGHGLRIGAYGTKPVGLHNNGQTATATSTAATIGSASAYASALHILTKSHKYTYVHIYNAPLYADRGSICSKLQVHSAQPVGPPV